MAAFTIAFLLLGTLPQPKSRPPQSKVAVLSTKGVASALGPLRHLAAGCALFVGVHTPAARVVVPPAFADGPAMAVAAPATPIAEAWDYANQYFLDRTFGDHDWKAIKAELVDKAPDTLSDDEVDKLVKDMYRLLGDRYSRALSRVEADALSKYDVTGVNVNVMRRPSDGKLVVSAVPPKGSESDRAGVRYGDQVVSINGVSMQGKSPFDALEVIQSSTDNTVTMELLREAQGEPQADGADGAFAVRLKRAFTASSPVLSRIVRVSDGGRELNVGYVKLSEFNSVGKRQVGEALTSMQQRGVDGYVLDLRGNGGGVLEGALGIGGYFMGRGAPVVSVIDGFGSVNKLAASEERIVPTDAPVAVLVDGRSASASEVLAGALRDTCRATIVGDVTYGKGVIQGVFGLRNGGAVILTLAKYQSPSGAEINGVGVIPNVRTFLGSSVFPPLLDGDVDVSFHAALDARAAGKASSGTCVTAFAPAP